MQVAELWNRLGEDWETQKGRNEEIERENREDT